MVSNRHFSKKTFCLVCEKMVSEYFCGFQLPKRRLSFNQSSSGQFVSKKHAMSCLKGPQNILQEVLPSTLDIWSTFALFGIIWSNLKFCMFSITDSLANRPPFLFAHVAQGQVCTGTQSELDMLGPYFLRNAPFQDRNQNQRVCADTPGSQQLTVEGYITGTNCQGQTITKKKTDFLLKIRNLFLVRNYFLWLKI